MPEAGPIAMLVAPSIAWHAEYGYSLAQRELQGALDLGCWGALMHGGPLLETKSLLTSIRAASPHPFFAAAELCAGLGDRFPGATALPPLSALDDADLGAIRRAARITAREARAAGINWALAPSCVLPDRVTPIERARTFAGDDAVAGAACAEWLDACQAEGVVATPGPYPLMRPITAEAALDAGAGAIVLASAHATDPEIVRYLREETGYEGIIVALLDAAATERREDEEKLAVACITAGCDLLLGCEDVSAVVRELRRAQERGVFDAERVRVSCARIEQRAVWADVSRGGRDPTLDDATWALRAADAAVHTQRGRAHTLVSPVDVIVVDDDPVRIVPAGRALIETLEKLGYQANDTRDPRPETRDPRQETRSPVVVALIGDRRLSLGFSTFSDAAVERVRDACAHALRASRDVIVVHFTPPDFAKALPFAPTVVCAWNGTRAMEEAVARWLARAT